MLPEFMMWSDGEFREVRVFLSVADELHFARAAEKLCITPSYVSQTIRALETRLGGRLFARTSRRVSLPPLGQQLLSEAAPAYAQLQTALTRAREAAIAIDGQVHVGSYVPGLGGAQMDQIIQRFEARYPRCRVAIHDVALGQQSTARLRSQEIDLLITRLPVWAPDFAVGPVLTSERPVIAVAAHHPLAGREAIDFGELSPYTITDGGRLPPQMREMMDAFIPPRTPAGHILPRANVATVAEAFMQAATGNVVHVTVASVAEQMRGTRIVTVPIRDRPPSQVALVWLRANRNARLHAFLQTANDVLGQAAT